MCEGHRKKKENLLRSSFPTSVSAGNIQKKNFLGSVDLPFSGMSPAQEGPRSKGIPGTFEETRYSVATKRRAGEVEDLQ